MNAWGHRGEVEFLPRQAMRQVPQTLPRVVIEDIETVRRQSPAGHSRKPIRFIGERKHL